MEIEGMIMRDLGETGGVSKAGNQWKKHEWVLETLGNYPRKIKFHVFGDKADTITFELGKTYVISVDIESREFNERWYTDVNAFAARPAEYQGAPKNPYPQSLETSVFPQQASTPQINEPNSFPKTDVDFGGGDATEDLPF